jgi:tetratricopeptide (TPR) repeat protein
MKQGYQLRRRLGFCVVLTVCLVSEVHAQAARVIIVVNDVAGRPIKGVAMTVTSEEDDGYEVAKVTDDKGKIIVTHIDSQPTYVYRLEKEGYQVLTTQIRSDYTETARIELILVPLETEGASPRGGHMSSGGKRAQKAFFEGAEAQKRGELVLAEEKFRKAAELSPGSAEPHIALAVIFHQRGLYGDAVAEAEVVLGIKPSNEQALSLRYDALRRQGDVGRTMEAAGALRKAGLAREAATTVFAEAMNDFKAGDNDGAVIQFRQTLDLEPEMVDAWVMLADVSLNRGKAQEAAAMASKALEIDPNDSNALKVRYDALRMIPDPVGARRALKALIEADPDWAGTGLFNHAVELYNANQMADAATALTRVVEVQPDDAMAHYLLGMARYNLGETEDARKHLTRFLELAPNDPDAGIAREMLEYASK